MEISNRDLISAAVGKALTEIDMDGLANVLTDYLNEKATNGYSTSSKTRLEEMVNTVTSQIAREVVTKVVEERRDQIRSQIIAQLDGVTVTAKLGGHGDSLDVSITL